MAAHVLDGQLLVLKDSIAFSASEVATLVGDEKRAEVFGLFGLDTSDQVVIGQIVVITAMSQKRFPVIVDHVARATFEFS